MNLAVEMPQFLPLLRETEARYSPAGDIIDIDRSVRVVIRVERPAQLLQSCVNLMLYVPRVARRSADNLGLGCITPFGVNPSRPGDQPVQ